MNRNGVIQSMFGLREKAKSEMSVYCLLMLAPDSWLFT